MGLLYIFYSADIRDYLLVSNVYWTVHHCNSWRMKDQLDVICYFISIIMRSTCSFCRLKPAKRTPPNTDRNKSSNTQRTENKTTDVVIHQHSRKLLKMDILMSETCWAHNKWNKIASDIKLVFHSSIILYVYHHCHHPASSHHCHHPAASRHCHHPAACTHLACWQTQQDLLRCQ